MRHGSSRWLADRRQRRHHEAFRIEAPRWSEPERGRLLALATELREWAAAVAEAAAARTTEERERQPFSEGERGMADAATNLWRARRRLSRLAEQHANEAKRLARYLSATEDALAEIGLVIQDHDGMEFHSGLSIEVLAFEEDPAASAETVRETVRPSVYFGRRRIQMGQVIVASPSGNAAVDGVAVTDENTVEENHA